MSLPNYEQMPIEALEDLVMELRAFNNPAVYRTQIDRIEVVLAHKIREMRGNV
jgi:hypothetical protein